MTEVQVRYLELCLTNPNLCVWWAPAPNYYHLLAREPVKRENHQAKASLAEKKYPDDCVDLYGVSITEILVTSGDLACWPADHEENLWLGQPQRN